MVNRKIKSLLTSGFWMLAVMLGGVEASFAQDTIDNSIEQKLENIAEDMQSEDQDYTNLIEALNYFRKHPINLNSTNKEELQQLTLLDELQIQNLLEHISKSGKLISIYELQSIDGFDPQTIRKILPYVKVADITEQPHATLKEILEHGDHEIVLRESQVLEQQKGFSPIDSAGIVKNPNSRYIGSPQKLFARYRFTFGTNVSFGITGEKDPGELFFKKNQKFNYPGYNSLLNGKQKNGFDFYSAHLFIRNIGFAKAIAIGDYQAGFGQGLTMWSGLSYRKGSDAVNIKKYASGIRPYTSTNENMFMRGAAATVGNNALQFTGFFSRKKIDANVITQDTVNVDEAGTVSSLQTTGLHTTPSEIADKDAITQTVIGGNTSYKKRKFSIGITGLHTILSASFQPNLQTYNQFDFTGKQLSNAGIDYSFLLHNFNFFGEASMSDNGGYAFLNCCIVSLDPKLSISILHRNIQRNYQNLFANAFTESSAPPSNEQGLYMGITVKPTNLITLNAFYDHFIFPWLKYQVTAPSYGTDILAQLDYTPNKRFNTYIRLRRKDKFTNSSLQNTIDFIVPYAQTNYRWNMSYQVLTSLTLHNRVELIVIDTPSKPKENGYLIYQDVAYKIPQFKSCVFTFRYALFDTKNYDTRIYAMEQDVPGSYSIPSYYDKGSRVYLMMSVNITRNIQLWLRYSQTYYANQNVISAGTLNEIDGHKKSEVKAELKMRF